MMQNAAAGDLEITHLQYLQIISWKTAALCQAACGLGAMLSQSDPATIISFEQFGDQIGVAFQIIDDVLDIEGESQRVGKTLGTDLSNRKATLPLIHCLSALSPLRREQLIEGWTANELSTNKMKQILAETESIAYARHVAREKAVSAYDFAASLPNSPYAHSLKLLAEFVISRTH